MIQWNLMIHQNYKRVFKKKELYIMCENWGKYSKRYMDKVKKWIRRLDYDYLRTNC